MYDSKNNVVRETIEGFLGDGDAEDHTQCQTKKFHAVDYPHKRRKRERSPHSPSISIGSRTFSLSYFHLSWES